MCWPGAKYNENTDYDSDEEDSEDSLERSDNDSEEEVVEGFDDVCLLHEGDFDNV